MSTVAKFQDTDTGESCMDVVEVPEGVSLQMYYHPSVQRDGEGWPTEYISIVLDRTRIEELVEILRMVRS